MLGSWISSVVTSPGGGDDRHSCREGINMTNIQILGWYNQRNVGDEAFKDVFRAAAHEVDPAVTVSFHTQRLPSPTPEKIILGGGDVIRPYYLHKIPEVDPVCEPAGAAS